MPLAPPKSPTPLTATLTATLTSTHTTTHTAARELECDMPLAVQEIDASHLQMLQRAQKVFRNESMGSKDELKKYEAQLADTMADILQRLHEGVLQCVLRVAACVAC